MENRRNKIVTWGACFCAGFAFGALILAAAQLEWLRETIGAFSGWAAALGALYAASIAYKSLQQMRRDSADQNRRHLDVLETQLRRSRTVLRRAESGVVGKLEAEIGRLRNPFFDLSGFGNARSSAKDRLRRIEANIANTINSRIFEQAADLVVDDIEGPAAELRNIINGEIPPENLFDMFFPDAFLSSFDRQDRRKIHAMQQRVKIICNSIRQAMDDYDLPERRVADAE